MKRLTSKLFSRQTFAALMMAVILGTSVPFPVSAALAVDITADGQNSLTLASDSASFEIELSATDATSCQLTSPGSLSGSGFTPGSSITISPGNPSYPSSGGSVTFSVTCLDAGGASLSDSVTVTLPAAPAPAPTVDVDANGSDGPVTLNSGDTFTYTWTSANATACQQTSPETSGSTLSGTSSVIDSSHPFYPAAGSSVTITFSCTNGTDTVTDSVVVSLATSTPPPTPGAPTVDVDANGSDGPITLNSGDTYTYIWTSSNATSCEQTAPEVSGVPLSGTSSVIDASHPFYPSAGAPVTITFSCTDGTDTATDSVVINLATTTPPPTPGAPTVDVKANGSDGPITLNSGDTYVYTWTSANATSCEQTAPEVSGVPLSGTSSTIGASHPFYPAVGAPVTITFSCTNGTDTATDSVVINLATTTTPPPSTSPSVDVKANGSDGPVTIEEGETYVYTWVSANATSCQMTSPVVSGVSLSGTSATITPSNDDFYPTESGEVTITIVCTDGDENATDSVIIRLEDDEDTRDGGGGRRRNRDRGEVLAGAVECPWIHDYMRIDFANDPVEVMKLQAFLKVFMGYDYVTINGIFDQATHTAVGQFQMAYKDEILTPWGHTAPTHYVYILTLKKINEIYCQQVLPLTGEQVNEIVTFRNLAATQPVVKDTPALPSTGVGPAESATSTSPQVGEADKGQNMSGLAAALFTFPDNLKDTMQCLYEFVLIALVLYILGTVLKDVLYTDVPENRTKRFLAKWAAITVGLLAALVIAFVLRELCLMLPLTISTLFSLLWLAFYPQHDAIRTKTRSWFARSGAKVPVVQEP